jgi:hypothetical protein
MYSRSIIIIIAAACLDHVNFCFLSLVFVCLAGWLAGWGRQNCLERVYLLSRKFLFWKIFFCFLVWKSLHPIGFCISSGLKGLIGFGFVVQIAFSQYCTGCKEQLYRDDVDLLHSNPGVSW